MESLNLELIDLGTQDGATYDIRSAMYKEITFADIFIADLTGYRHNVMVEVGYALNSGKLRFDELNPGKGRSYSILHRLMNQSIQAHPLI